MDLLCTENIMKDYETELLCQKQLQNIHNPQDIQIQLQLQHTKSNSCSYSSSCYSSSSSCSTSSSGYISTSSTEYGEAINAQTVSAPSNLSTSNGLSQDRNYYQTATANVTPGAKIQNYQHKPSYPINVYTHNIINRTLDFVNTATKDPTFLTDRCLENALKAEEKRPYTVGSYFQTVQKDITPPMRKIVAEWMMEVCAEEKCQEEVVLLALNYMDRFLSNKSVRKTNLQILAAACLLLASKLREPSCRALSAELLVFYTDNSIHKRDLIKWELYVLSRLGWDLSSVTPLDFLELLLIRLPIKNVKYPDLKIEKVRLHAQTFISLAAKEYYFSMYSASTIAASSIAAALRGLNWHLRTGQNIRYLLNILTDLTSVDQDNLSECMTKLENVFDEHSRDFRNRNPCMGDEPQPASHQLKQQQNVFSQHSNISITNNNPNFCSTSPPTERKGSSTSITYQSPCHHTTSTSTSEPFTTASSISTLPYSHQLPRASPPSTHPPTALSNKQVHTLVYRTSNTKSE